MAETSNRFLEDKFPSADHRTWIKICGMTRVQDAVDAASLGAHAIGLIFYEPSSRNLDCERAREIRNSLPDSVSAVAVVVNPDDDLMSRILSEVQPDYIQFHGSEPPERCDDAGVPYIKAVRVRSTGQIYETAERYPDAKALLLDAYEKRKVGGTGRKFSWKLIPDIDAPIILAGGLSSRNVGDAIAELRPTAVDVSTGVESSGGLKDRDAMSRFISAVQHADGRMKKNP